MFGFQSPKIRKKTTSEKENVQMAVMQIEHICNSRAISAWVVSLRACCCQNCILIGCACTGNMVIPYEAWAALISYNNWSRRQCNATKINATQRRTMQHQYPAARQLGLVWITWLSWPTHRLNIATSCFEISWTSISQFLLQERVWVHCIQWCRKDPTSDSAATYSASS